MRRKDLTTQERNSMLQFLLTDSSNGRPKRGKINEAATKFSTSRKTVSRLRAGARKQQEDGQAIQSISGKLTKVNSRKRIYIDMDLISSLELFKRSTIRRLAQGIQCSKSTVGRWISKGLIRAHTNALKPDLTAPNKLLRLRFSLEALEFDRVMKLLRFKSMHNIVEVSMAYKN